LDFLNKNEEENREIFINDSVNNEKAIENTNAFLIIFLEEAIENIKNL